MSVSLNPLGEDFEQGFFRKAESFIANTALEIEEGIFLLIKILKKYYF